MQDQRRIRLLLAAASLAAIPFALFVDAAIGLYHGWRPNGTIENGVICCAALWLIAVAAAFAWPRGRAALAARAFDLALLCISCIVGGLLVEAGAATIANALEVRNLFHTRGPNVTRVFKPLAAYMPGLEAETRYTTDVRGVRTPGVSCEGFAHRILCIGGSTTECVYLDDAKTWPALLMQRLNEARGPRYAWVGAIGFSGFATADHVAFLRASPIVGDFDCVVVQPGINDLKDALDGKDGALHINRNTRTQGYRPLWARSRVIQLWHDVRREPVKGAGIEAVDGSEYAARRAQRAAAVLRSEPPDLAPALQAYRARLRAIIDACRKRGVGLVFTTQPVLCAEGLSNAEAELCWFGWMADGTYLSLPALRGAVDQYNAALMEVCAAQNVACVDLSPMNGNEAYFYDDCHFTNAGADEVARRLSEWFAAHPLGESGVARK